MPQEPADGPPDLTLTDSSPAPPSAPDDVGHVGVGALLGRYRITERIGQGGMGVVFAAHDPELDRTVAVKLLRPDGVRSSEQELRLRREGQVMAKLSHPNVIRVYDVGVAFGSVFVAMEFVDGGTLRAWLDEAPRSHSEILAAFAQAGRGLAASHDAGLVHRDFKPSNVLVGKDGRVLVTDFGLARASAEVAQVGGSTAGISGPALLRTVTRSGGLLGTPAYMAPEQHQGKTVDARADQFSFCVALWRALYRSVPFVGDSWQALSESTSSGRLSAPPPGSAVPAHVRAALARGLQPEPAARFPSMHALLAAVGNDPRLRRRRRVRNALLLSAVLLAGFAAAWMLAARERTATAAPCPVPTDRFVGIWDDARKDKVRTAFLATGKPYAGGAFDRAARTLDIYTKDWASLHVQACQATRVSQVQSEDVLDLRMECLARRRQDVEAQVELMVNADEKVVQNADRIVSSLPGLGACNDIAGLRAPVPLPIDLATRTKVEEARKQVAKARAFVTAGKYDPGKPLAEAALVEARALGYRPLEAEALIVLGKLQHLSGQPEAGAKSLEEGALAARAGRDAPSEVRAWAELVWLGTNYARFPEAHLWGRHGLAAFESLNGSEQEPLIHLLMGLGSLALVEGKYDESLEYCRRALVVIEKELGSEHIRVAGALECVGGALGNLGRYDEQEQLLLRAVALWETQNGNDHPELGSALFNLAFALAGQGRLDEALVHYRRTLDIWERSLGKDYPRMAVVLTNIGVILIEQGKDGAALPFLERALIIAQKKAIDHPDVALVLVNLAAVLHNQGKLDDAETSYSRAIAIWENAFSPDHPYIAYALTGSGINELKRGRPARAVPMLERALKIHEKQPADLSAVSETRFALARALRDSGRDSKRAYELATRARTDYAKVPAKSAKQLAEVDAWLASGR